MDVYIGFASVNDAEAIADLAIALTDEIIQKTYSGPSKMVRPAGSTRMSVIEPGPA